MPPFDALFTPKIMPNFDLLDLVLPTEGRYCIMGLGKYPDQNFAETREEALEIAQRLADQKFNVYFGVAKYGVLNNRTQENAKYLKALWMDIDCGEEKAAEGKGYVDQATGMSEFKRFCKAVGLPKPILVNSGNGLHMYWPLAETVSKQQWDPLAKRLRQLCADHNLIVDPAVFETARIMRMPNTYNYRYDPPSWASIMSIDCPPLTYEQMKELLGAPDPEPAKPDFIPAAGLSPMMEAMMSNQVKRFKTIMMKSAAGEGCQQLLHCYNNQDELEEPLWRAGLSIAAFCVDSERSTHLLSNQYHDYDPAEVDKKVAYIQRTGGPYKCETFEKLNPGGCDGCPNQGKIKSPIVLGLEIAEADEDEVEVVEEESGQSQRYAIPEYPFPFFRGQSGGIYKRPPKDAEETEPQLVYEHDLYVLKRMHDPDAGETLLFRLHLPRDGVREFSVPLAAAVVKEKLRDALAPHGVAPTGKQIESLLFYVTSFVKNLQYANKAEIMRTQFGWVDKDSKFILGDREITKDGVFYSPPSITTRDEAKLIYAKGTLEKWKEVFNMYSRKGLEPHAFAALTAFGSPLLKFTGLSGAIINVIYPRSGSGKSTTLYVCNSVYGEPQKLASIWKDTAAAKIHRLGVLNNLPNTIDEITNITPLEFSDLSYSISQGRGKNKMKSQTNEMRLNNTSWQGITLSSANASFYEKLGAAKDSPDGESMRLLEYTIAPNTVIDVAEGKEMFDHQMYENFGHAGEIYIQWLVNNLEDAKALLKKVQAKIDKEVQFTSRERFWSAVAACNITGGLIARSLGLHDLDMAAVYDWLVKMLNEMREDIKPPQSNPAIILGEFINAHMTNALVVNGEIDARSNLEAMPIWEPRGELLIRYEPDNKHLYVAAKQFKDFCVKQQINYKGTLRELHQANVFVEAMNKRMSKGMKVVSPAVRVLKFDASTSEFIQMDAMLPNNEDRDGDVQH